MLVGSGVGLCVGFLVGSAVGCSVGASVGSCVGEAVGFGVGSGVGIGVGSLVGTGEESGVGIAVGIGVRLHVGIDVGNDVGAMVVVVTLVLVVVVVVVVVAVVVVVVVVTPTHANDWQSQRSSIVSGLPSSQCAPTMHEKKQLPFSQIPSLWHCVGGVQVTSAQGSALPQRPAMHTWPRLSALPASQGVPSGFTGWEHTPIVHFPGK
mmetsp:Transcript_16261/g.44558  ORF Transcript_16261/g.44558 Transcript_16261/m.44558 type:complete len:207 (+) Transcript_16261:286-906(+)